MKWALKRIYCLIIGHDFETAHDVMSASAFPWFKCSRCGHEEGL